MPTRTGICSISSASSTTPFHLRCAAGEHHAGAHVLFEAAAAQFGLHHLEDFLVARLHRLRQRLAWHAPWRAFADARDLDAFLGLGQLRQGAGIAHLDLLGSGVGVRSMCAMSSVTLSPAIGSDALCAIAPCRNTARSVVPAPMSTSTTPSSRSSRSVLPLPMPATTGSGRRPAVRSAARTC
jgi:hypothetical protein